MNNNSESSRVIMLGTIRKLIKERYPEAKAVFWVGSFSKNEGNDASDIDLIIVYEKITQAYREAFIYDTLQIDAFVHDRQTLNYFFEESRAGSGISGLINMIIEGQEILTSNEFSANIKQQAQKFFQEGPAKWDQKQIDKERFLITDVLQDIKSPSSRLEQIASTTWLYEALSQFYFRSQNKWCASGKSIIRYLIQESPQLANEFNQSFEDVFQHGNVQKLQELNDKILAPYGGLLWAGFKSKASKDCKIPAPRQYNNIHVLTRAVVIDEGHILLCQTLDLTIPFYFLPGGHVEHTESAQDALLRELLEESGANCTIKRFLECLEYSFEPGHSSICHNHEYNFIFEAESSTLKVNIPLPQLEKHIKLLWMPLSQLNQIDFRAEPLKDLIPKWLDSDLQTSFQSEIILNKNKTIGEKNEQ